MSRLTVLLRYYNTAQYIENPHSPHNHPCRALVVANQYFPNDFASRADGYCHHWQDYFLQDSLNKHWHYCDICALGQDLNQINQLLKEIQSCTSKN